MQVPFFSLQPIHNPLRETLLKSVVDVLDGNDFILGKAVTDFEKQYAQFSGTEHCIGVSNGLDALKISLRALGIGKGDEVIVPAHTYIATVFAVMETGAVPVLGDVDAQTYNISSAAIEGAITPKTKAIIAVHLYGQPCDMPAVLKLAEKHNLFVIEDNAQAQGARCHGTVTGSMGHINATSFYPSKNLGALGDAGAITTNDAALANTARMLGNVGSQKKYHHELIGYNARLDSMQAAMLSCKLPYLDEWNIERRRIADRYLQNLKGVASLTLPAVAEGMEAVYHLFVIRHERRDALQNYLTQQGVQTLIHYPLPNHLQPALRPLNYSRGDFPITEQISESCLSLPLFIGISDAQVDFVSEKLIAFEH